MPASLLHSQLDTLEPPRRRGGHHAGHRTPHPTRWSQAVRRQLRGQRRMITAATSSASTAAWRWSPAPRPASAWRWRAASGRPVPRVVLNGRDAGTAGRGAADAGRGRAGRARARFDVSDAGRRRRRGGGHRGRVRRHRHPRQQRRPAAPRAVPRISARRLAGADAHQRRQHVHRRPGRGAAHGDAPARPHHQHLLGAERTGPPRHRALHGQQGGGEDADQGHGDRPGAARHHRQRPRPGLLQDRADGSRWSPTPPSAPG